MVVVRAVPYGAACAAILGMALLGDGTWLLVPPAAALLAASLGAALLGYHRRHHHHPGTVLDGGGLRATRLAFSRTTRWAISIEERIPPVAAARRASRGMMNRMVHRSGHIRDTERDATLHTRWAAISLPPSAATGVMAGLSHDVIFLGVCGLPAAIYLAPHLRLRVWAGERRAATGGEAAFFLAYVHIMQTVGVGLYRSLEMLSEARGAFPAMSRDAALVCRMVVTGGTRSGALLHYARHHPVQVIREFVSGYVAKQSALGDVPGYTAEKARQAFAGYEAAWSRYEKGAQEIFGGIMMFAIVLPMMIMLSAMIGTPETVQVLLGAGTAMSPMISAGMVAVMNQTQPATGSTVVVWRWAPLLGMAAGFSLYLATWEAAPAISVGALALAAANWVAGRGHIGMVRSADRMLPEFIGDMAEMSRAGSNVPGIIQRQARRAPYDRYFNGMIREVAGRLGSGRTLDEVLSAMSFPTANMRFVMFLLGVTYRTGGGTPAILEMITGFAGRIHQAKEAVTRSLAPLCWIVYATPFITLGLAQVMLGIFAGSASDVAGAVPGERLPFSPISGEAVGSYMDGMALMATAMSVPMGVVAAKISSYTIRDTAPVGITAASNLAAITLLPMVVERLGWG